MSRVSVLRQHTGSTTNHNGSAQGYYHCHGPLYRLEFRPIHYASLLTFPLAPLASSRTKKKGNRHTRVTDWEGKQTSGVCVHAATKGGRRRPEARAWLLHWPPSRYCVAIPNPNPIFCRFPNPSSPATSAVAESPMHSNPKSNMCWSVSDYGWHEPWGASATEGAAAWRSSHGQHWYAHGVYGHKVFEEMPCSNSKRSMYSTFSNGEAAGSGASSCGFPCYGAVISLFAGCSSGMEMVKRQLAR